MRVEEEKNIKSDFLSFTKISAAQAKLNSTTEECEQHDNLLLELQNANESLNNKLKL